jgi:hypothetical protein
MFNKKLFAPFFALASCATFAVAQQAPSQQVTLESGLQVTIGTCTRSSQSISCPLEVANNGRKSVMWNSSAYGDSVRVIDADGTAYNAPVSFGNTAAKMTAPGQTNKGSFTIAKITSSAAVLPVVQYGSLEFRGVKVGGAAPSSTVIYEKPKTKEISIISSDKKITAKLIGCDKWNAGFKCDVFLSNNGEKQSDIGLANPMFNSFIASTDDGKSLSAANIMVLDVDNLNGRRSVNWPPQTDVTARMYFETKTVPLKVLALQFFAFVGYDVSPFVFKNIIIK